MSDIYEKYKEPDGYLYFSYSEYKNPPWIPGIKKILISTKRVIMKYIRYGIKVVF